MLPFLSEGAKDVSSVSFLVFYFMTVNMSCKVKALYLGLSFIWILFIFSSC